MSVFLFFSIVFVCVVVFFSLKNAQSPLSGVSVGVAKPLVALSDSGVSLISFFTGMLRAKSDLISARLELVEEIEATKSDRIEVEHLRDENTALKELLGRPRSSIQKRILAVVLMNPPATVYDTLLIDVGADRSIKSGAVVLGNGFAVGSVSEVGSNWSKVRLFSAPNEERQVLIGSSRVSNIATGRGGGNFETKLPREIDVVVGDPVVFPEFTKEIVGVVGAVEFSSTDSFSRVLFKSPINISEIRFVEVVLDASHIIK